MGFFNNWPFSNLHNLNLDWIVMQIKKLTELSEQIWERVKPLPGGDPSTVTAAQAYGAATYAEQAAEQAGQSAKTANAAIDSHKADKNNPHDVTPDQIGAEPKISLLDISKGGTGGFNPVTARANLGARADFTILPVSDGGTGSSTQAGARAALGITPNAIGAVPNTGGIMTGTISWDTDTPQGIMWTTANGTRFFLRPYPAGNILQLTRTPQGGAESNAWSVNEHGDICSYGSQTISRDSGNSLFIANRSDTDKTLQFGIGASGTTRGIYDMTHNRWVFGVYDDRVDINIPGCTLSLKTDGTALLNGKQISTQP